MATTARASLVRLTRRSCKLVFQEPHCSRRLVLTDHPVPKGVMLACYRDVRQSIEASRSVVGSLLDNLLRRRKCVACCRIALVRVILKGAVTQDRQHKGVSVSTADVCVDRAAHSCRHSGYHCIVLVEAGGRSLRVAGYLLLADRGTNNVHHVGRLVKWLQSWRP